MTESELEAAKNFRSSYYESLGFRAGEKGAAHLQALISAEAIDVDKLRQFCLKRSLPAYYRPVVWRLVLGVDPPYNDKGMSSFLQEQRLQQFRDLHRALVVMGWIPALEPYTLSPPQAQPLSQLPQPWPALPWHPSPENFVLLYLLEQNRLLSAAVNQMKHDRQVTLCSIAKAFLSLFSREAKEEREKEEEEQKKGGKESEEKGGGGWRDKCEAGRGCEEGENKWIEVEVYWMFSRFVCYWEEQLSHIELLHSKWLQCLHEVDPTLYDHLFSLNATVCSCVNKWLCPCFAGVLPESCLESIWDKVIAGSGTVLAYVVVAILLSLKRQLLRLTTAEAVAQLLGKLPQENLGFVGVKAVELWEASGDPTL